MIERIASPQEGFVTVTTQACMVCNRKSRMTVEAAGYEAWEGGVLIQKALPDLTNDERELLKTGTHPDCWDVLNPDEPDEWYEGDYDDDEEY